MSVLKYRKKYPEFRDDELYGLLEAFNKLDVDQKGYLEEGPTIKAVEQQERQNYDVVRRALDEVGLDSSRRVEQDDYIGLIAKLRHSAPAQAVHPIPNARASTGPIRARGFSNAQNNGAAAGHPASHKPQGSVDGSRTYIQGASGLHSIDELVERAEYTRHINAVLSGDADLGHKVPFPLDTGEMIVECKNGLLLAKLINDSVPDTIDDRVLNKPKAKGLNNFQMNENNQIVVESAKAIGCSVVNVGPSDIVEQNDVLILGLIWQVIRRGLLNKIDIKLHPNLYRLLEDDETLEQFLRLSPEKILLRWFNYHLKNAGWNKTVNNFDRDVKEGDNYTVLLNQLAPDICSRGPLQTSDLLQRAEQVLDNADRLGCRKFLTPQTLVSGNPKLNLAFVANLFNEHPGLEPLTEEDKAQIEDFDAEGEREARVYTLWLNSLSLDRDAAGQKQLEVIPNYPIQSYPDDLRDGYILLKAYDRILPGLVNWRQVSKPKQDQELMRFKALENTNYVVALGLRERFSLVGIQGADIADGVRKLTSGLVWQLMRRNISEILKGVTDEKMIQWANDKKASGGGKSSSIRSFGDRSLGDGKFLLDVLSGVKKSYVDYSLVHDRPDDQGKYENAKLAISIARKLGATIFLVPEDIVQVRSKLITTFVGALMDCAQKM